MCQHMYERCPSPCFLRKIISLILNLLSILIVKLKYIHIHIRCCKAKCLPCLCTTGFDVRIQGIKIKITFPVGWLWSSLDGKITNIFLSNLIAERSREPCSDSRRFFEAVFRHFSES